MSNILFLLTKGRNFKESLIILKKKKILLLKNKIERKLYIETTTKNFYIMIVKNLDFLVYIKNSWFDFIFIGEDMILFENFNNFYKYILLKINIFFLSVISNKNYKFRKKKYNFSSKYNNIFYNYLIYKNIKPKKINIVKGSVENSCIINNSIILDIVSSGETIKKNNLFELKKILVLNCYIIYNSNIIYNKIFSYMEKLFIK